MTRWLRSTVIAVIFATISCAPAFAADTDEFFEQHIRPLLVAKCYKCHSAEALSQGKLKGGLRVDTREGLRKGGESGPAVVPGKPQESTLLSALRYEELEMPPDAPLAAGEIALVEKWIRDGAVDPRENVPVAAAKHEEIDFEVGRKHWSYQPVREPNIPQVKNKDWPSDALDHFILSQLEDKGIAPSPPGDRRTWIRRVSFDLVGLPPTYEEVEAFVADESPDAREKAVDRLLASPHYGERWARHWLDVARYADSRGYIGVDKETRYAFAYTYRDYVVRALNEDKPYNRFVLEQMAADQLEISDDKSELAAMGFLTAGHRFINNKNLATDQTIDVVSRGLLGLTVACARCHDHKYDAIAAADYYSLYGIFASGTEPGRLPIIGTPKKTPAYQAYVAKLEKLQSEVDRYDESTIAPIAEVLRNKTDRYLTHVAASLPNASRDDLSADLAKADLKHKGLAMWRKYLAAAHARRDPVFVPWHGLAAISREQFPARASELIAGWQKDGSTSDAAARPNPLIIQALVDQPPKHMIDVALAYAKVLMAVDQKWKSATKAEGEKPTKLNDAAAEQIRQVLYGPQSPYIATGQEVRSLFDAAQRNERKTLTNRLAQHDIDSPGAPPRAMVLFDQPKPVDQRIFLRGDPAKHGDLVARRYLRVLSNTPQHEKFTTGSGRLELAQAIASNDNPLTARVIVNRVWQHHFGQGLVRTPSDFGTRGELPTHPELLDHLAATFVTDGWSLKRLHRRIVLSQTYGQASAVRADALAKDPDNRLLWRYPRRRLEFEPFRDSLLAVSGQLDRTIGGRSVDIFKQPASARRSLYAEVRREEIPALLRVFDVANPNLSTDVRTNTTVPQQALFMMNSPFVLEQAEHLAKRAAAAKDSENDDTWVRSLYRLALSREPDAEERKLAVAFLKNEQNSASQNAISARVKLAQALLETNEFMFID